MIPNVILQFLKVFKCVLYILFDLFKYCITHCPNNVLLEDQGLLEEVFL